MYRTRSSSMDEASKRAQEQIHAARLKAEQELEKAAKQANKAIEKSNRTARQHPYLLGALAGSAIAGGVAAWLFSRKKH